MLVSEIVALLASCFSLLLFFIIVSRDSKIKKLNDRLYKTDILNIHATWANEYLLIKYSETISDEDKVKTDVKKIHEGFKGCHPDLLTEMVTEAIT